MAGVGGRCHRLPEGKVKFVHARHAATSPPHPFPALAFLFFSSTTLSFSWEAGAVLGRAQVHHTPAGSYGAS